jgi:cobalt-zinc-cadmium resistance protein CzcA
VELREGPNQIQRDDAKRRISVAFNVRGRDVETVVEELQSKIDRQLKFAPGYYTTYGGQFENLRQATDRLSIAVPVALVLIFVLLFFTFRSLKQSVMIFTAIPLSAIGGIGALWLRDMPFSISAGVGFIALFGVAVLNGIVLIGYFNQLKADGITDLTERIMRGTEVRLRPVLMTATVASLGFLPMALAQSAGAEVQRPLATVVIGGLISATLLTLLVLPVLYALSERGGPAGNEELRMRNEELSGNGEVTRQQQKPQFFIPHSSFLIICLLPLSSQAQSPLTASQAVTQALQTNGTVLAGQRALEAQQAIRRTAYDFGRTTVQASYGQYNSQNRDNQFTITQGLALPGVYRSAAGLADARIAGQQAQLAQVQAELRRQVRLNYEQAVHARHRLRVLRGQDSVYTEFLRSANLRFKTGEAARLEPATALVQQGEIRTQLLGARTDFRVAQRQLQALLQVPTAVQVADSLLRQLSLMGASQLVDTTAPALADTLLRLNNPQARVLAQQVTERRAETRVAQAAGLPEFTMGYFNQSIIGYQRLDAVGTERYFGPGSRFQGIQAGVAVPLLRGPQKARVQAARLQEQVAQAGYDRYRAEIAGQLDELQARRTEQQQRLRYFETIALPQATVITRLSTTAYKAGETGYSEYLLNLERARRLRLDYLDALLQHNKTVIELEYLLGSQ